MVYTWIAVAVVLGLLIGFVTLSVVWTARTVEKSIRDRSIELISAYDDLLEERSRELSALDVELEQREKQRAPEAPPAEATPKAEAVSAAAPAMFLKAAEHISTTPYEDSGAGEAYRKIRQTFSSAPEGALKQLVQKARKAPERGASALLEELPFETVYRLSTLAGEEQLRLLRQTLPAQTRELLEAYASSAARFDCVAFYDALKASAAAEPGPVRLRIAPQDERTYPEEIEVTVDEEICEGFQIEMDNVLYDYCIKAREIG